MTADSWKDDAQRDLVRNVGERAALFVRGEGAALWMPTGAVTSTSSPASR